MTNKFANTINQAVNTIDHTEVSTGPTYTPPVAGATLARFIEYIEVGKQKQKPYKGQEKKDADQVYVTFELLSPKHIEEKEIDGVKTKVARRMTIPMSLSLNEKAKFKKLFKKMTYGRQDIKHMSQMLGEGFLVIVTHNESGEGTEKRVYANLTDDDGSFNIKAPAKVDDLAGTSTPIPVPDALSELRLFIFDLPNKETWDSIFIDGEYEVKDAKGNTTTVSKNKYQDMVRKASNFEGSAVETFLEGSETLPTDPEDLVEEIVEETKPKKTTKKDKEADKVEQEDPLAALGLA